MKNLSVWAATVCVALTISGCGGGGSGGDSPPPPAPVAIPNVVGQTQAAAATGITGAGLVVGTVTMQSSGTVASGNVISESPAAGSSVAKGSAVNLVVSSGPPPVAVPNVVGQTQAAATTAITGAGLLVGTVTLQSSSTVASGNVISESPTAGSSVTKGSAVNLAVSTGPGQVAVPSVVSQTQASATMAITAVGLTLGTVTQAFSATAPAGSVISESPAAGTSVSPGTAVNLVVSSTFTAVTASMTVPRAGHTATLLPNGQVLITGGDSEFPSTGTTYASAELYTPSANTFTALAAAMTVAREGHAATLLPSGQVLLTGGFYNGGAGDLNSAELYSPAAGTFTAVGAAMTSARTFHTATLLSNGRVLITGGSHQSGTALNTAEMYNPTTNTFTTINATMTVGRQAHTATLLPNGQVLIAGGRNGAGATLSSAELYDPIADTFTALSATMTVTREGHTATLLPSGLVLVAGGGAGATISSFAALASAELYDPVARTFTPLAATLTTARTNHTATLLPSGEVLLAGGVDSATAAALETAEMFEAIPPTAQTFTAVTAVMTTAREAHAAALLPNGQVLLTGGNQNHATPNMILNSAESYSLMTNTFTPLTATMTTARWGHSATLLPAGKVLLAGGATGSGSLLNSAELYDPVANAFTTLTATLATARSYHTATLLPNGKVLIAGGANVSDTSAELYDPVANTFTALTATLTYGRYQSAAALLPNGTVFIAGGYTGSGNAGNTAEIYDPAANTFTLLPAKLTVPRQALTATMLPNGQVLLTGGNGCCAGSAELYNPAAGTFTTLSAKMTADLQNHTATLLTNGQVLITGGDNGTTTFSAAELYSP